MEPVYHERAHAFGNDSLVLLLRASKLLLSNLY